jgi:hypothetical protein
MLGPGCEEAAMSALRAYPNGLQIGGEWGCSTFRRLDRKQSHPIGGLIISRSSF